MAGNNISVSVTADIADLVAKRAVLSAELKAATADLNGFAKTAASTGMTDALKASMLSAASAVAPLRTEIKGLDAELKASTATAKVEAGAIKTVGESFASVREMMAGFGGAITAALALGGLTDFAKKMGEAGEKVEHTAKSLGMGVGDVQQLNAAFTMMGVDADKGVTGIERLYKAFATAREGGKQQAAAFKELGVSTTENYHGMELLGTVMDGFAKQADGPAKAAEAMTLFGRAGAALIPFLDLGRAGLEDLNRVTAEYDVKNTAAAAKAAQLGSAFNENKVAMTGLGNVMASAFAPALTAAMQGLNGLISGFIKSYDAGGIAKQAMDLLTTAVERTFVPIVALGSVIHGLWDIGSNALPALASTFAAARDTIVEAVNNVLKSAQDLGEAMLDVMTGNWAGAAKAGAAAITQLGDTNTALGAKIKTEGAAAAEAWRKTWAGITADSKSAYESVTALWSGKIKPHGQLDTTGEADGDTSGDQRGGGKKGKKDSDAGNESDMQALQEAFEDEENAHNSMLRNMQADELAYWSQVKTNVQGGALSEKDAAEVRMKVATLTHQQAMQEIQEEITARRAAESQAVSEIQTEASARKALLDQQIKDVEDAQKRGEVSAASAHAQILVLIEAERTAAIASAKAIEDAHIQADNAIKAMTDSRTTEFKAAQKDMDDAAAAFEKARVKANADANKQIDGQTQAETSKFKQQWDSAINPLVSTFTSGLLKMAEGTQTFAATMRQMGQQVLTDMLRVIDGMVERWLWSELTKTAAAMTSNASIIAGNNAAATAGNASMFAATLMTLKQDAAKVFGGLFAAFASNPATAPAAPAIAAAGAAAVMDFSYAAQGWGTVPFDNMPTLLHQNEMVLPAKLANPMRDMLTGQTSNENFGNNNAPTWGGDVHIHAIDAKSFRDMLSAHPDTITDAVNSGLRSQGKRPL